ncbi:hypothetical protein ACFYNL_20505 [Streptomyces sp. NPDC007808]|uniref:hypothetical protein n=1 Tax=Streptomyces sp. NPDC007808 TaxID=3364779 RepID=UPI0036C652C6
MADDRHGTPEQTTEPIPRDMPDQQAAPGEDPLDIPVDIAAEPTEDKEADDVPDTDEAGTGRQGSPQSGTAPVEDPQPEEPTG